MPRRSEFVPISEHDNYILPLFPSRDDFQMHLVDVSQTQELTQRFCLNMGDVLIHSKYPHLVVPGVVTSLHVASSVFGKIAFESSIIRG